MKVNLHPNSKIRRAIRVRSKLHGTAVRPRLTVFRSNHHLSAQLINDDAHKTLFGLSTAAIKKAKSETKSTLAEKLGEQFAKLAADHKITQAIFDRGSYRYHGRIKVFADSARKNGLKI